MPRDWTRWYCLRCQRALEHDNRKRSKCDTVNAPKGATVVHHDGCGGVVKASCRHLA